MAEQHQGVSAAALTAGLSFADSGAVDPQRGSPRERLSLNRGWRFTMDDPMFLQPHLSYESTKPWFLFNSNSLRGATSRRYARPEGNPGSDIAYVDPAFDDSTWRSLDLPHDWGIEGQFQQHLPGGTGKLPYAGIGWYRKTFSLPGSDAGRRIFLDIDGAMSFAMVWLNGQYVGGWPSGYTSFQLDLTPFAKAGDPNVLAIRLDNPPESSRWYPGGGIYRNVWLTKTRPIHIAQWGVYVYTPRANQDAASVAIQVLTDNETFSPVDLTLRNTIYALDAHGRKTGTGSTGDPIFVRIPSRRQASNAQEIVVSTPRLWSVRDPHRYVVVTTIHLGDELIDCHETPFGIRTIGLDADRGFLLNGEQIRLQGVCIHSDLGALGVAVHPRAIERQLEILKEMGANAIRTSHNPPAPEFLDACDRMGFLVIDEAFDCWQKGKCRNGYHRLFPDWHEADLRALVRRDRNHPCVILWSIGNEVIEQWRDDGVMGWQVAAPLSGIVHQEDRTRPVTAAFNNPVCGFNGFQTAIDVMGFNYQIDSYQAFRRATPSIPLLGSETASTISSRGEYFFPLTDNKTDPISRSNFQVSSYDLAAVPWGSTAEEEFRAGDAVPGYAGEFVWTGFDYLGEPTPYNDDATNLLNFSDPADAERMAKQLASLGKIAVPSRSSYFGIIDLAGFLKDRFYLYQARWRSDLPMAHILPHWTWPERPGQRTPVHVYTNGDEAELFLNQESLGRKTKPPGEYRLRWDDVIYVPGQLRVVSYRNGEKWAEAVMTTAGPAARLRLEADRPILRADRPDLCFVSCMVEDAAGQLVPRANPLIRFSVTGPADLLATDNGDATSFESFQSPMRRAYNGRALAIIRPHGPARLRIQAEAKGLTAAECEVTSR